MFKEEMVRGEAHLHQRDSHRFSNFSKLFGGLISIITCIITYILFRTIDCLPAHLMIWNKDKADFVEHVNARTERTTVSVAR